MSKTAVARTNDPRNPAIELKVSGKVARFVRIDPRMAVLRGPLGTPLRRSIRIVPEQRYPFRVMGSKARDGKHIRYSLQPAPDGQSGYILEVENIRRTAGRYHDTIMLETDSEIQPQIRIAVYGQVTDPNGAPPGKKKTN